MNETTKLDLNFLTEEISAYEQTFVLTSYD